MSRIRQRWKNPPRLGPGSQAVSQLQTSQGPRARGRGSGGRRPPVARGWEVTSQRQAARGPRGRGRGGGGRRAGGLARPRWCCCPSARRMRGELASEARGGAWAAGGGAVGVGGGGGA